MVANGTNNFSKINKFIVIVLAIVFFSDKLQRRTFELSKHSFEVFRRSAG